MPVKTKEEIDSQWGERITRGGAFTVCLLLLLVYAVIQLRPDFFAGIDESSLRWFSATAGRMGLVLGAFWIAFPAIQKIKRLRGGGTILVAILIFVCAFLVRPKSALYLLPIGIVAVLFLLFLGFFAKPKSDSAKH